MRNASEAFKLRNVESASNHKNGKGTSSMTKRMIITLIAVAAFLATLGFVKYNQIQTAIAQGASYTPPPEAVTTIVATQNEWQTTLGAIGTVTAAQGVVVSADLPGLVASIDFDSGKRVRAGDMLVRLDTKQEKAQLAAAEAQQRLAHLNLERMKVLQAEKVAAQAEFDQVEAEAMQAEARVNEIRATIERKTIRAPFGGILGIRQVNLGQYVNPGQAIVPLQSLDPVYVDFAVPQQEMRDVQVGAELDLKVEGVPGVAAKGQITAINSVVDQSTRNINVQATFPNRDGKLRPGMFVEASVIVGESRPVVALPASAIAYTPYGDFVFIVEDIRGQNGKTYRGVRQQSVKLGSARGDQVAVIEGVKIGEEIVTSGVFKLRSGAAVLVSNEIQPANDPTPNPEDN
jgi:membrane fusion protein, multidrug efflux system